MNWSVGRRVVKMVETEANVVTPVHDTAFFNSSAATFRCRSSSLMTMSSFAAAMSEFAFAMHLPLSSRNFSLAVSETTRSGLVLRL
ncbi:hypothetical protein CLOP_g21847 [Closterium sp. NIES-67]|nr:hypothetical protein CLOP_g21847 [Closterium sp. NIES-67]